MIQTLNIERLLDIQGLMAVAGQPGGGLITTIVRTHTLRGTPKRRFPG